MPDREAGLMGYTRPAVVALREAIAAVLRDAEHPLTTAQVIAELYTNGKARPYLYYSRVYSNLRAMANQDLVVWHDWTSEVGGNRACFWERGPAATPAPNIGELDAIWKASK